MANQDERRRRVQIILVVEDEALVRLDAAETLRYAGYDVHEAADAHEAIDLLQSKRSIDLLFTDVNLGDGMNGIELGLWALSNSPGLKVLVTTGDSLKAVVPTSLGTILLKPYPVTELLDRVKHALVV